jgi:hypothetical protein
MLCRANECVVLCCVVCLHPRTRLRFVDWCSRDAIRLRLHRADERGSLLFTYMCVCVRASSVEGCVRVSICRLSNVFKHVQ